ncbi:MATE family efflux transporter [Omnitrophica bacterium]|nr:MATE family efflux transporter [Candidatus Omnitrophota bacterium]
MNLKQILQNKALKSTLLQSWSTSWPMTLIMFFIFLIGFTDVYIAGKFGKEVQAAYGLAFHIYFIFLIISMAFTVGSVSVISRLFTSKREKELISAVSSSVTLIAAAGLLFGTVGFLFGDNIIRLLGLPRIIKGFAATLIIIYSAGMVFHYSIMNTNGILRACKMVRKSLWTMSIVCVLNIGLNLFLSLKTPLRFRGIAVSTVISLIFGSTLNLYHLRRLIRNIPRVSFAIIGKIATISWPAGLLQILWHVGTMVLFLILSRLPRYNVETMAAFTNGLKIESVIFLPAFAFSMANAVVVGNFLGEKRDVDAFRGGIITSFISVVGVTMLTIIVMLNARYIASFLSTDNIVIKESMKYIYIALLFEPFMAWGVTLAGGLNGAGDTKNVMLIASSTVWLLRVPLSYLLGIHFGFGAVAVWWSMNVSVLTYSIFISKRYFSKAWIAEAEKILAF